MSSAKQTQSFRLAHLSDLHFSKVCWSPMQFLSKQWIGNANLLFRRIREFQHDQIHQLAEYFKQLQVDYVLVSGDLSTTSQPYEFEQARLFLNKLESNNIEVITLPGNHDHYTKKDFKTQKFYEYFNTNFSQTSLPFAQYNLKDHKVSVKQLSPSYWLLALDTALATPLFACHGSFSEEIEETLRTILNLIPSDDTVIIANHFPLFTCDSQRKHLQGDDRFRKLLQEFHNIKFYMHGHTHRHCIADLRSAGLPILLDSGCASHKTSGSWNLLDFSQGSCTVKPYYWNQSGGSTACWIEKKSTVFNLK